MNFSSDYSAEEECYPLSRNGRVLVLNMTKDESGVRERKGSEFDISKIRKTFAKLHGFKLEVCQNFTMQDIKGSNGMLAEFIERLINDKVDALFIFIMAHGGPKSALSAFDGRINFKKDILRRFSIEAEPLLAHISKAFVVNACRGDEELFSSWRFDFDNFPGMSASYSYDNTLILYSTLEGFVSNRDPASGSPMIQMLCNEIRISSSNHHLVDIFNKASLKLKNEVDQLPEVRILGSFKRFCLTQSAYDKHSNDASISTTIAVPTFAHHSERVGQNIKIEDLKPRQKINFKYHNISLYARMLYKTQVETGAGKSTCYKFLFRDDSKDECSEIEGVAFNAIGMILYNKLQVGQCVQIKEADVDIKSWEYRNFGLAENSLQLTFKNGHGVAIVTEMSDLPKYPLMNITALRDVEHKFHRDVIDVLGTITHSPEKFEETAKGSKFRAPILKDTSDDTEIPLTIWGNRPMLVKESLVFIRAVRVIKPAEIREWEDDLMSDYEIRTVHYSISQQSVITEITTVDQVPCKHKQMVKNFFNINKENDGGPERKVRKTE